MFLLLYHTFPRNDRPNSTHVIQLVIEGRSSKALRIPKEQSEMISSNWAKKRVEAAPPKKDMKKGAACRSAAGKDGVGEIYTVLVFGWNLRYVHRPGGGLGKIEDFGMPSSECWLPWLLYLRFSSFRSIRLTGW
jgi:hypothetical protein